MLVPQRHRLAALSLAVAVGGYFWIWSFAVPVDYVSSSLLSYETPHHFLATGLPPDTEAPTVRIADSIFSLPALAHIADQIHYVPEGSVGRAKNQNAAAARIDSLRAHIDLFQPAPGLLEVTYRSHDQKQVESSTDAIAAALAAWVPPADVTAVVAPPQLSSIAVAQPPAPPVAPAPKAVAPVAVAPVARVENSSAPTAAQKHKAAELRHRADILDENVATLALQKQGIENRIQKLTGEKKNLQHPVTSLGSPAAARNSGSPARQETERQLTVARKLLKELRQSYADDYPDVQAVKDRVAILEQRLAGMSSATAPAAHTAVSVAATRENQPRLAAIAKSLAPLQALRASVASDLESNRKQVQSLRAQAAEMLTARVQDAAPAPPVTPASAPAPVAHVATATPAPTVAAESHEAAKPSVWLGHFIVLSWAEKPRVVGDNLRLFLLWSGLPAAFLTAVAYLVWAGWYFRPVTQLTSLRKGLPSDVKFLGVISGGPLMENPS
jgi:hypothetical protein